MAHLMNTSWSASLLFILLLVFTLPLFAHDAHDAHEPALASLDWQAGSFWNEDKAIRVRFRAEHFPSLSALHSDRAISEQIHVKGNLFQAFTVCARKIDAEGAGILGSDLLANTGPDSPHRIRLEETEASLTLTGSHHCSESTVAGLGTPLSYPSRHQAHYQWQNVILSNAPFLVQYSAKDKNTKVRKQQRKPASPFSLPISLFPDRESAPYETGGGSWGTDDHDPFNKRPPFFPMQPSGDVSITLLPILRLVSNWQQYLPGTQSLHWLLGEPDQSAGLTLQLRFNDHPPVVLHISQAEFGELSEHLLNTRQLLYWLAPKLNGRAAFIQQLLALSESMAEASLWQEEPLHAIHQQLITVLEQPDTGFSLEFELHQLDQTLSGLSLSSAFETASSEAASPENTIIQLPYGTPAGNPPALPPTKDPDPPFSPEGGANAPEKGKGKGKEEGAGKDNNAPGAPSPLAPSTAQQQTQQQTAEDYFAIVVGGTEFRIKKNQLPPLMRGQENPVRINAYNPQAPAETLPLNEVEAVAGIPEQKRLSTYGNKPLDYLLTYGSVETKNDLQEYFPVNLISECDGQLVAELDHRNYPVDETCKICRESLMAQHSLTHCAHSRQHVFHTGCLASWMQEKQREILSQFKMSELSATDEMLQSRIKCPLCQQKQPSTLCYLLSKKGLVSGLHRAAITGDNDILKATLESKVNLEAKDELRNTALHLAAQAGHSDIVLLLTGFGVNTETENKAGQLPIAVAGEHFDIIDIIKQANENPNIFFTAGHGRAEALREWLAEGNDLDITRPIDGASLLHLTVENNRIEIAEILLDEAQQSNINLVNMVDFQNRSPMHTASDLGNFEACKLLLEEYADVDLVDSQGRTALMLAVTKGHLELAKLLLGKGAKIDLADSQGRTALMLAVTKGHLELAKLLLGKSAVVDLTDSSGTTALMMAAKEGSLMTELHVEGGVLDAEIYVMGNPLMVKLLLEHNAKVNLIDSQGATALFGAIVYGAKGQFGGFPNVVVEVTDVLTIC